METDPKAAILKSAPESERRDPVPGSAGRKTPAAPSADEDNEGRSDNERLAEAGIEGAEHDQMRQASLKPDSYNHSALDLCIFPVFDHPLPLVVVGLFGSSSRAIEAIRKTRRIRVGEIQ
ncbi:MAG: hypothetical protein WAO02_03265 [Verrucomicrobiia bacterium]